MLKDKVILITGSSSGIGAATVRLTSDRASFITGQTVIVDGGYTIGGK